MMKTNCATFKIETRCDFLGLGYASVGVSLTTETKVNEICTKTTITTIFCNNIHHKPTNWFTMRVNDNPFRMIDDGALLEANITRAIQRLKQTCGLV